MTSPQPFRARATRSPHCALSISTSAPVARRPTTYARARRATSAGSTDSIRSNYLDPDRGAGCAQFRRSESNAASAPARSGGAGQPAKWLDGNFAARQSGASPEGDAASDHRPP